MAKMWERSVAAGEILIKEGDTGLAASELYVVKSGKFEVCVGPICMHLHLLSMLTGVLGKGASRGF